MGNINYVKNNDDENFQKRGTQTPPASRCGTWVGSFRKGCWSNSIWSRERWRHAGGCQNAETWGLCNHHSVLPMYDGGFVTNLPVLVATPQRALTRKSGKPWCQSWKFSATSVTTTTSWTCWAPALKEVITLLRYNCLPSCQPLTLIYLCVSLRPNADDHGVLQPWRPPKFPAGSRSWLHGINVEFRWGEGTCCLQKHGLRARPTQEVQHPS